MYWPYIHKWHTVVVTLQTLHCFEIFADDTSFKREITEIKHVINCDLLFLDKRPKTWLMDRNYDVQYSKFKFQSVRKIHSTFSEDPKWNDHIENLASFLRKLKFILSRNNLEKDVQCKSAFIWIYSRNLG